MLKKLSDEKQREIIDCAIHEFAHHGLESAKMVHIAKEADISVGVLYKYYVDKDDLFLSCVHHFIAELENFLGDLTSHADKPLNYARAMITAVQEYSRQHVDYIRLYHVITGTEQYATEMAHAIEDVTSNLYIQYIASAQKAGNIRRDLDPALFALFFDNLLMMMQFAYCCPYYMERFKMYGGDDVLNRDELVTDQLLRFMESAFTLEQADIQHKK